MIPGCALGKCGGGPRHNTGHQAQEMIDAHLCDEDGHGDPQDPDAEENRSCPPGQDQRLEQEPADAQRRVKNPDKEESNGEKNRGVPVNAPQVLQRICSSRTCTHSRYMRVTIRAAEPCAEEELREGRQPPL